MFEGRQLQETPKQGDPSFRNSRYVTVLSNQTAVSAAAELAKLRGVAVEVDNRCDDWDYAQAADYLLARLRARTSNLVTCLPDFRRRGHRQGRSQIWNGRTQSAVRVVLRAEDRRRTHHGPQRGNGWHRRQQSCSRRRGGWNDSVAGPTARA